MFRELLNRAPPHSGKRWGKQMSVTERERERERRLWNCRGRKHMRTRRKGTREWLSMQLQRAEESEEEEGKRGQGGTEWWSDGEEYSVWTFMCVCVCWREGGYGWLCGGMCSLSQESPGAKAERSTSLPREGVTGQPRLFLPAPPSMHGKRTEAFNVPFATNENQNFSCNSSIFMLLILSPVLNLVGHG